MKRDEFIAMLMKDSPSARDIYAANLFDKFVQALENDRRDPIMSCLFKHCRICLFDNVWSFMFKTSDNMGNYLEKDILKILTIWKF